MIIALGWLGLVLYLVAHIHLSFSKNFVRNFYYCTNLVAAIGFVISSAALSSWQSTAINVFWVLISIAALMNIEIESTKRVRDGLVGIVTAVGASAVLLLAVDRGLSIEAAGWTGALLYCAAYFLLADKAINRRRFLVMNLVAAIVLIPAYWGDANWPALWMSITWTLVSVIGLLRLKQAGVGKTARLG